MEWMRDKSRARAIHGNAARLEPSSSEERGCGRRWPDCAEIPISPELAITGSYRRSFTIHTAKVSFCANALICDASSRKIPSASSNLLASASVKPGSSTVCQVLLGSSLQRARTLVHCVHRRITSPRKSDAGGASPNGAPALQEGQDRTWVVVLASCLGVYLVLAVGFHRLLQRNRSQEFRIHCLQAAAGNVFGFSCRAGQSPLPQGNFCAACHNARQRDCPRRPVNRRRQRLPNR